MIYAILQLLLFPLTSQPITISGTYAEPGQTLYLKDYDHFDYTNPNYLIDSVVVAEDGTFRFDFDYPLERLVLVSRYASRPVSFAVFADNPQFYYYSMCANFFANEPTLYLDRPGNYIIEGWAPSDEGSDEVRFAGDYQRTLRDYYATVNYRATLTDDERNYRELSPREAWSYLVAERDRLLDSYSLSDVELGSFRHYLRTEIELGAINEFFVWAEFNGFAQPPRKLVVEILSLYTDGAYHPASVEYFKLTERYVTDKLLTDRGETGSYVPADAEKVDYARRYARENIRGKYVGSMIESTESTGAGTQETVKQPPNILLLCIDDLRPELASFGADYIHSPNIDALAARGFRFFNHYVNAPSCGPSRYTLLTGRYGPPTNQALFQRAERMRENRDSVQPSMPEWFRERGYTTVSVGKVSHHPGGRGGQNWDNDSIAEMPGAWDRHLMPAGDWQHPRGAMHGLAHGEIRTDANAMDVYQTVADGDGAYPDGLITNEALRQLRQLSTDSDRPFYLAVGLIKPHLPFGAPERYMEYYQDVELPPTPHPEKPTGKTTWHPSNEFYKYHRWGRDPNEDAAFADSLRRHYAACVTYADAQVGKILAELERTGAADNTIVVLWGDHGWHLGEHAIWGKHSLYDESLHSPLIMRYPGMPNVGEGSESVVETLDIFPTLTGLSGLPTPDFADGHSLLPLIEAPAAPGHPAYAYTYNGKTVTVRTEDHRLILHENGSVELYDMRTEEGATRNVAADEPDTVERLKNMIGERGL